LEREIGDVELRRLKTLCDTHFDSYRLLYEPLKTWLTRSDPTYRAQLASLLQPSQLLINHFASVSGSPIDSRALVSLYDAALQIFFDTQGDSINRSLLRKLEQDDEHKTFPNYFHKVLSPRPLLNLKCLPGEIDKF
jgi:hypothetical protein